MLTILYLFLLFLAGSANYQAVTSRNSKANKWFWPQFIEELLVEVGSHCRANTLLGV